jgi:hypothetical protein
VTLSATWSMIHSPCACSRCQTAGVGTGFVWFRRAVVADLAVQRPAVSPQPEPPVAGTVADRVGRQLVRGGDDVVDPRARQPGGGGVRRYGGPQRVQRVAVESLFKDRGAGAGRVPAADVTAH